MALIRGCHVLAKGDSKLAAGIAWKIIQTKGLLVGNAGWGTGAYAFYVHMVPNNHRYEPLVIFDVDEKYVTKRPAPLPRKPDYAYMKMYGTLFAIIPIYILGFFNLPNFPVYTDPIGFF